MDTKQDSKKVIQIFKRLIVSPQNNFLCAFAVLSLFNKYSEPVDLDKETVSLRQLVAKMEQVTSRDLASLVSAKNNLGGLVISTDASTDQVTRKAQLDILWGKVNDGLSNVGMFHLWRSAIRGYDDKEWEVSIVPLLL